MIRMDTRIYGWLMQMNEARMTWSQQKTEAEHDRYLEQIMYQYHGINVYAEEERH